MRKAIIAAIVASALFAVGAFAAEFTVDADDVASGADDVGSCADDAVVEYTTAEDVTEAGGYVVTGAVVSFFEGGARSCMDATADLAIRSGAAGWSDSDSVQVDANGQATFDVAHLPVGAIDMVSVLANGSTVPVDEIGTVSGE